MVQGGGEVDSSLVGGSRRVGDSLALLHSWTAKVPLKMKSRCSKNEAYNLQSIITIIVLYIVKINIL